MPKTESPRLVGSSALVSLRLRPDDVKFIINELRSCAQVGAEDTAYRTIPDELELALAKHEAKQANDQGQPRAEKT